VTKPAPKKPPVPVRRESLRLERRESTTVKLEDRFLFHSEDKFPPPHPFTNCPKTYPTKELFGIQSPIPEFKPQELKRESPVKPTNNVKAELRKSEGAFFSKIFSSKPHAGSPRTSLSNASPGVLEVKKIASKQELLPKRKPVIAKKPTLDRKSLLPDNDKQRTRPVSRSQSLYSAPRPEVRIQFPRMSEVGAGSRDLRDKENVELESGAGGRVKLVRRAPPPPPRSQR